MRIAVLLLALAAACAGADAPTPRVLDLPDDQEVREGEPGTLRHQVASITTVRTVTLAEFRALDPRLLVVAERRGAWLYWAVTVHRDVPIDGGSAWLQVTERFRAPIDPP